MWKNVEEAWAEGLRCERLGLRTKAIEAYQYAASLDHSAAQVNLGALLDTGDEKSQEDAVHWYIRAAELGESSAAWNLALLYKRRGDNGKHQHWLEVAARMGDDDAKACLR